MSGGRDLTLSLEDPDPSFSPLTPVIQPRGRTERAELWILVVQEVNLATTY